MRHLSLPRRVKGAYRVGITYVVILTLTALILIALLYPEYFILKGVQEKNPYHACQQSVEAASFLRVGNTEFYPYLTCETQQYTVTKNDPDEAKKVVAEAMKNCFYQFGRGEKELFSGEGNFCFVCSIVDFEGEGKKIRSLPEFQKFLFENPTEKNSYAKYLYKANANKEKELLLKEGKYTASVPVKKTGVIFTSNRWRSKVNKELEEDLKIVGYGGGVVTIVAFAASLIGTPVAGVAVFTAAGLVAGAYAVENFADYGQLSTVIAREYSVEELDKLKCTQEVAQKPS